MSIYDVYGNIKDPELKKFSKWRRDLHATSSSGEMGNISSLYSLKLPKTRLLCCKQAFGICAESFCLVDHNFDNDGNCL